MRQTIDDRDIVINQGGGRALGRFPWRLLLAVVFVALLIVAFKSVQSAVDPLAREQHAAELYRNQQLDSDLYTVDMLAGALLRLAVPLALAGAALGAVGVGLRLIYMRWAAVASVQAHYHVQALAAAQQPVPHTLTYSPHYSNKQDVAALPPALDQVVVSLPAVPSFGDLLAGGSVGKGNPLLLGYDVEDGTALTGSWLDLYSTAIGGLPGTGKTTSQRFLACQTALHGAGFVIVDPHAGAGEDSLAETLAPLAPAFLCEPASDDKGILQAVRLVADVGRRRVHGDRDRKPLILWLDETTALLSRSSVAGPLAELLEQIAQEYRKVAIFAACSGQIWAASRTGDDSALRDSFASVWAHRMKRSQARLLLPTGEAERVERLDKGQALIWRTSGATNVIQVPNTTAADVVNVAGLLAVAHTGGTGPLLAANKPEIHRGEGKNKPGDETGNSAPGRGERLSAEEAQVLALFYEDDLSIGDVVKKLWPNATSGTPYNQRRALVEQVIKAKGRR